MFLVSFLLLPGHPDFFGSQKHSSFSTTFPIYLLTQRTEEVPIEEETVTPPSEEAEETKDEQPEGEEEEAVVEDLDELEKDSDEEPKPPKTKTVVVEEWVQMNPQAKQV